MQPLQELLPQVRKIARDAGTRIIDIYEREFSVKEKEDNSPLTEADLASHRHIVEQLAQLTPHVPVLSEESAQVDFSERDRWRRFWLVDPLDGTKEFIKRNGEFTVNIALIDDHQPVLGVVYAPVKEVEYFGTRDNGAFRCRARNEAQPIAVANAHEQPLRIVGSRSHRGSSLDGFLERVGAHQMVPMGSSLKICLVADGSADIYPRLGPTCEWDTAAAHAVLAAAGGRMVDLEGAELTYNRRKELLNPFFVAIGGDQRDWLSLLAV